MADADYEAQVARIVPDADAVFAESELIVKVKEPQPVEWSGGCPDAEQGGYQTDPGEAPRRAAV